MQGSVTLIEVENFKESIEGIWASHLSHLAEELSQLSYIGATGELSKSWEWAKTSGGWIVVNTASESLQRVVGVPPGTPVTQEGIDSIALWAKVVLEIDDESRARQVASQIAQNHNEFGSERWASGDNFLLLSKDGTKLANGSPVVQIVGSIVREINNIVLI